MRFHTLAAALLLPISNAIASPAPAPAAAALLDKRQTSAKYCSPDSGICYLQYSTSASNPVFRIAIPDSASGTFDILLQIIAPVSLGWAGFAWGGSMTANPLTVAWPNGNKATVSSRWASVTSGRTLPGMYPGATYKTVSSSKNATHWSIEVVCTGCSKWSGGQLSTSGSINTFAWAYSRTAVSQPASTSSSFAYHNNVGMFSDTLSTAKVPQAAFQQYVKSAS